MQVTVFLILFLIFSVKSESFSSLTPSETSTSCNIPCQCGYLDTVNCICYQQSVECFPPNYYDSNLCACIRVSSSGSFTPSESSTCDLSTIQCPFCHTIDPYNCNCLPNLLGCMPPLREDREKCSCVMPGDSPYCPGIICPKETHINEAKCECTTKICQTLVPCPTGKVLDLETCSCVCPLENCPPGIQSNPQTCECIETPQPECPPGFLHNPVLCECECAIFAKCQVNFVFDKILCKCICPKKEKCDYGYSWCHEKCQCTCKAKKCEKNFIFNAEACDCICDSKLKELGCAEGFEFDDILCECVKINKPKCPKGFHYNEVSCICEPILRFGK